LLETRTNLTVRGGDFPIDPSKAQIASFIQYAQLALVGLIMLASDAYLPVQIRENKFMAAIGVWFIGNTFVSVMKNTGAFEIYLGKKLIWSTLTEGRMPSFQDLATALSVNGGIDIAR